MTEAARAIQTVVVTEAVRDAAIGGRKVKRGQTIALDPDDGLVAVNSDRQKAVLAAMTALKPGFELVTLFYGDGADLAEAEGMAQRIGATVPGRRGRGPSRWPAVLPLPDLGRVAAVAKAPAVAAAADRSGRAPLDAAREVRADGAARSSAAPGSGSASTTSATCSSTCRGGTTTCARCSSSATSSGPRMGPSCRRGSRVTDIRVEPTFRRRVQRTIARLDDDTGSIEATWFGRRFIERRLRIDSEIVVSGKVKRFGRQLTFDNPEFQVIAGDDTEVLHAGRIVPVYRLTAGLTAARLRTAIREALDRAGSAYPEYLPDGIRQAESLTSIVPALEEAHYPASFEGRDAALRRLAFDELLALQLGMVARRRQRARSEAATIALDEVTDAGVLTALTQALGQRVGRDIELTADQVLAASAIRDDLARPTPMLRLLQGDVGSGKTAIAAYALAAAARNGLQGALLAPTDLLARQHVETVGALLADLGIGVTLLTGSLRADARSKALGDIATGQAPVVVGTHALIQEAVTFRELGLVVIDEQHRFGVGQRDALEAKAGGRPPHVLLMTATPIPRTLGQVLYADLDVSDLRTPPVGRVPIRTGIRRPDELDGTWRKVREEAALGHRTFVVVPLIDDTGAEMEGAVAAESEAKRLKTLLTPLRVGLVHGRLKAARPRRGDEQVPRRGARRAGRDDRSSRSASTCPRRR